MADGQRIMPDGWWYEGSVNYNIWVSRYICKMALAAEPFGINLIDHYFTPGYSKEFRRLTDDVETRGVARHHPQRAGLVRLQRAARPDVGRGLAR